MANWCSNSVAFEGTSEALAQIQSLFQEMAKTQEETGSGLLPDFIEGENGHFFEIYWDEGDVGIFHYQTRWSPNIETLVSIADSYQVAFVLDYEEIGNLIYGQSAYNGGMLTDEYLEAPDFESFTYDEANDCYLFEGETYFSDYEILEKLLERKIMQNHEQDT